VKLRKFFATALSALVLAASVPPHAAASSDPRFFNLSEQWNQRFRYLGEKETEAAAVGFLAEEAQGPAKPKGPAAKYFAKEEAPSGVERQRHPPPQTTNLAKLKKTQGKVLEMYLNQILTVNGRGIERTLSTTPDIVEFYSPGPESVQIKAIAIGKTYVHIWDAEGRSTYQIRVTQAPYVPTPSEKKYLESLEGGESFQVGYSQNRTAFYQDNSFETLGRSSLSYQQNFTLTGDTPHGYLDSGFSLRRFSTSGNGELAEIYANLEDARIGPFRHFDLNLGDDSVTPELLILPSVRLRGANIEYRHPDERMEYTVFFGRELASLIGTLTPDVDENASIDSFLGGIVYDFHLTDAARWKVAAIRAYGQQRVDDLNDTGFDFAQEYKLGPHTKLFSDLAYDDAHAAYNAGVEVGFERFMTRTTYRDISKKFFTMIGNPGDQGEQGVRVQMQARPWEPLEILYDGDVWRERLFPLPGESDRYNVDHVAEATWTLDARSNLRFQFEDRDHTSLFSPVRDRLLGATYSRSFDLWGKPIAAHARIQDRDFESLSNPVLNYRSDQAGFGLQMPLWWDVYFSVQEEVTLLEETESRQVSHPRVTTWGLNQSRQVGRTPVYADWAIRYRDEEETESDRSFLAGEDRLELSGGLRYRIDNIEIFVDARYDTIFGESLDIEEPQRAEAEVSTGVRYLFDTNVYWEAQGAFEGTVYNDLNSDGVRQPDEPGLAGVVVRVGEEGVATDEKGHYRSKNVKGKKASVSLDLASVPEGYVSTTGARQVVPISSGGVERVDFGLATRSVVTGFVYNDVNRNGRFDRADRGVVDVVVVLDGKESRRTDARGRYQFGKTLIGAHHVSIRLTTIPLGYLPQSATEKEIELFEGMTYELNFPMIAEKTLSGRVFVDADGNGQMDDGETGAANVRVLFGDRSATTDGEGYYLFDNVDAGVHVLTVDPESAPGRRADFREEREFSDEPQVLRIDIPLGAT
jgi:hypothetical protein